MYITPSSLERAASLLQELMLLMGCAVSPLISEVSWSWWGLMAAKLIRTAKFALFWGVCSSYQPFMCISM